MADRKRAELAEQVEDACEGLQECGFMGLMETPVLKVFTELHKMNDTTQLGKLVGGLEEACTRAISAKTPPEFPELMVLSQLLQDVEGPAAPPEESPLEPDFKTLAASLRLALLTHLQHFARPGSAEAKQGVPMAAGMLLLVHEKVAGDLLVTLAVEHALLRLLFRSKDAVVLLRDRTWALAALNKQVESLKDHQPEEAGEGEEAGAEEEDGEGDEDEDEEGPAEAGGDEEEGDEEEEESG
ncbi:hypothetical protein HYH03_001977 [Edaphochlamys debaryana]|uniref:Uncharacterized protein n=1 Tax=Edaphochlamys debaryana TaxID=47281 RepID=A0A835YGB2_9CHLO|nr:hypothetical protein HYH03_001977 [Edaphochlamys debaryana]|eukprot:KAG2500406.1 hypothetical protein HYH03_001977 [Edaphochlamys debaryana]